MKTMMPVFFVIAIIALVGVGFVGYKSRKSGYVWSPGQVAYPSPTSLSGASAAVAPVTSGTSSFSLSVSSPADGSEVTSPTVIVAGQTAPNAEVFVNDASGTADANGNFAISTPLDEGENTVVVVANDDNGNSTEQELTVVYNWGS